MRNLNYDPVITPEQVHKAFSQVTPTDVDKIAAQLETEMMQNRLAVSMASKKWPKKLSFKERLTLRDQARNLAKKGSK